MSESSSPTHQYLLSNDGALLTLRHLAEVLHSTPNGVRMTIARRRQPPAFTSSAIRRRPGRGFCFDASQAAEVSGQANAGESAGLSPAPPDVPYSGDLMGGDRLGTPS